MNKNRSCLIVGAGMTGLTAGRFLKAAGWSVVLLDKGRSFGGRMATRRFAAFIGHSDSLGIVLIPSSRSYSSIMEGLSCWYGSIGRRSNCGIRSCGCPGQEAASEEGSFERRHHP